MRSISLLNLPADSVAIAPMLHRTHTNQAYLTRNNDTGYDDGWARDTRSASWRRRVGNLDSGAGRVVALERSLGLKTIGLR
jgi:hypothetical protein